MLQTIIAVTFIALTIITTLALCKAAGKTDRGLEHPERIQIRED